MFMHVKRLLAATIAIAAVALPTAAYARVNENPASPSLVPVEPPYITGAPATAAPVTGAPATAAPATASSSAASFQWGDAGIGAGGVLVLISVGAGTAVAIRRRAGRPVTG